MSADTRRLKDSGFENPSDGFSVGLDLVQSAGNGSYLLLLLAAVVCGFYQIRP